MAPVWMLAVEVVATLRRWLHIIPEQDDAVSFSLSRDLDSDVARVPASARLPWFPLEAIHSSRAHVLHVWIDLLDL